MIGQDVILLEKKRKATTTQVLEAIQRRREQGVDVVDMRLLAGLRLVDVPDEKGKPTRLAAGDRFMGVLAV